MRSQTVNSSQDRRFSTYSRSDPQNSSSPQQRQKSVLHFHSILCNPHLLENPHNTEHSFMRDLFKDKQIKKVRKSKDYLSIDVLQKRNCRRQNVMENYKFQNPELKKELSNSYQHLTDVFQNKQESKTATDQSFGQKEYYEWLNQMKNKPIIGWYLPYCQKGIKLSLLNILDYKIDDLALDIQNLGANSIDLIDGTTFKTCFLMIINSIRKFKNLKQNEEFRKQEILKQSQSIIINQMIGRDHKKMTVQTKISMITESVICFQILRVLDQKEVRDNERKINRQSALYKVEQVAFNCLMKVAKLPKIIDPSNSSKICSYRFIKPEPPQKSNQRKQESEDLRSS